MRYLNKIHSTEPSVTDSCIKQHATVDVTNAGTLKAKDSLLL